MGNTIECAVCGLLFRPRHRRYRTCSTACGRVLRSETIRRANPLVIRFWKKVRKQEHCWIWSGFLNNRGYGVIGINDGKQYAHRVSWELAYGPVPAGKSVLHRCDNPACVRPDHLFVGSLSDNMEDCLLKGRNKIAKLTPDDVRAIRALVPTRGYVRRAAAKYGVSRETIGMIIHRRTWRNLV